MSLPGPEAPSRRAADAPRHRPGRTLERLLLIREIVAAFVRARLLLRRVPLEAALAELRPTRVLDHGPGGEPDHSEARRLGWAVSRTLRLLPGDTRCLVRSLVLTRLLSRRGIAATLVIGARPGPSFLAHAWVELGGIPVLDPGDGSFARLVEL